MRRLLPGLTLAVAVACTGDAERLVLVEFFNAARLHDRTALAAIATVGFEPHVRGIVLRFEVLRVGPVASRPLAADESDRALLAVSLAPRGLRPPEGRPAGERRAREVTINAIVQRPDGGRETSVLVTTLERAVLAGSPPIPGRWIVTGVRE